MAQDSPLSIAASVIGILTFAVAILLGFYARAIQWGRSVEQLGKLDDEIVEMGLAASQSFSETLEFQKHVAGNSNPEPFWHDILTDMFYLNMKTLSRTTWILKQDTLVKMTEWDKQRGSMIKDMAEVKGLQSKRQTVQLVKLS
jgi:hypothetical protein